MAKNSRGKKQQQETEKQQHVIVTENNLFKVLLQKVFEITTESSLASLIVTIDAAADLSTRNLLQREEFDATPHELKIHVLKV